MSMILNPYRYAAAGGPTFGNASRDFESTESDHVIIGTGLSGLLTDAYTMTAWIKPESFPEIFNTVFGSHSGVTYQLLYVKSNGKLGLYHTGGSSIDYDSTGSETLVTGQWQHVAMTVSSDDGLRGYVNGIEDNAVSGGNITTPSATWRIGRDQIGRYWDGLLSSVRLYNRVLSAGEIETLASNGDVTSGLVGHWLTDYDDVLDYSGNGNDGTNYGSTYSTDGPFD